MKSALKKSVVSTSISLILASGMAAFAAHAADDVKLKASCGGFFRRLIERDSDARYSQALQFSM